MRSVVTRPLEDGENTEYVHIDTQGFLEKARAGDIVFPFHFGASWYGYSKDDWQEVIGSQGETFIFNVRPYVALILGNLLYRVRPVWIDVPDELRLSRVAERRAKRDNERRPLVDDDLAYAPIFSCSVENVDFNTALARLMQIHRGGA